MAPRKQYPSDVGPNSANSVRARRKAEARAQNTTMHAVMEMAKVLEPQQWRTRARQLLEAMATDPELNERARVAAATGLVRSLDSECGAEAKKAPETAVGASQALGRAYLEALRAEIDAKLAEAEEPPLAEPPERSDH